MTLHPSAMSDEPATNPVIHADVPDIAMIRVGDTYYMSSTTMHMAPGLPIMKSTDLVNWDLIGYCYDTLEDDNDALNLENGRSAYGAGSWASSIRYHDGTFYVTTFANTTGKTHVFTTDDIEHGPWKHTTFEPVLHDHTLWFDDDGRVYMLNGVDNLRLRELMPDLSGLKPGGVDEVVIRDAGAVAAERRQLGAEGSQMIKHEGRYYLSNITWPRGGMRTQIIHRADQLTGPYEGRVVLQDKGVAQGSLIDTPDGDWYAYLFRDHGAVGRAPFMVPMRWEDGWPVLGKEGEEGVAPDTLDLPQGRGGMGNLIASDDFDRPDELLEKLSAPRGEHDYVREAFPLVWQWNHNPDNRFWSLTDRPGFLRLTTGRVDGTLPEARNSLTQRTFGPTSFATTSIDVSGMNDGDVAGLAAFQRHYGYVGVKADAGRKSVVMVGAATNEPREVESVWLDQDVVYLKVECDFTGFHTRQPERATFFFSLDGQVWRPIGEAVEMRYTLPHFMGYRFALFNFATETPGGHVDFDFFRIGPGDEAAP